MSAKQSGMVVLATVIVVFMLAVLLRLYALPASQQRLEITRSQSQALAFSRDALVDYSVNYPSHYRQESTGPGHFPCPDINGNGSPSLSCSGVPIGLLPVDFRTRGGKNVSFLEQQAMGAEPIWYVLSNAFRYSPAPSGSPDSPTIVNSDTRGQLQLDDSTEVIALLIAPGPPLAGQRRDGTLHVSDYLEGENADGDAVFSSREGNDQILAIRWEDLMPLVERRVLSAVRDSLSTYQQAHGHMPWLASVDSTLQQGSSSCTPCQWKGWLATERYYPRRPWPPFSQQYCEDVTRRVAQPVAELPVWLVRNYWHRYVWLHLQGDTRGGVCEGVTGPSFGGDGVSAMMVSVGKGLEHPAHALGSQSRVFGAGLEHYLDSAEWLGGEYGFLNNASGMNDQWSYLP